MTASGTSGAGYIALSEAVGGSSFETGSALVEFYGTVGENPTCSP